MSKYRGFKILLLAIAFVLLTPLFIPLAPGMHALNKHRLRKAARFFACRICGRTLGADAIKRADEVWDECMRERLRQHPGAGSHFANASRDLPELCRAIHISRARTNIHRGEALDVKRGDQPGQSLGRAYGSGFAAATDGRIFRGMGTGGRRGGWRCGSEECGEPSPTPSNSLRPNRRSIAWFVRP